MGSDSSVFYVGAQVCVTSFFIRMAISGGGVDEKQPDGISVLMDYYL